MTLEGVSEEREEWERRVITRRLQHRYLAMCWYWGRIQAVRFDDWARVHTHLPPWLSLPVSAAALAVSLWSACR